MPDHATMPSPELAAELRQYFAATTGVALPGGVLTMSARTMRARRRSVRRSFTTLFAGGGAALATAGLIVGIIALRHGSYDNSSASRSAAAAPVFGSFAPYTGSTVPYPGVDTSRLAQFGDILLPPDGHGPALVSAAQAQTAAATSQPNAETPGTAVLAWTQVAGSQRPNTCLCWVVDVPITGGVGAGARLLTPPTIPSARTVLVLVDAESGRIFATLSAPGIP
jgi:hypothetical protein